MPLEIFFRADGIAGEAVAQGHVNEIELRSFSWGSATAASGSASTGAGAGKVTFQNATLTKVVDKASPLLFQAFATGQQIGHCVLTVLQTSKPAQQTAITFSNCLVLSINELFASEAESSQETIVISFAEFRIQYTSQKTSGGADTPVSAGWNLITNKAV